MLRTLLLALGLLAAPLQGRPAEVLVSGAASLADVLQQLERAYERQEPSVDVVVNVGASNTLARQIAAGARVDLFISADEAQMDAVAADVVAGSRVDLLSNQLAIAVPDDRARRLASPRELTDPAIRRIAVGDPAAVPAGVYARAYLESIGLWQALQPKLVPSGSVRLALAAVESGAADAAIVYRTDIAAAPRAREAFVVPAADGPRIVYPAAIIRTGRSTDAARRFLAFLRGPQAAAIFRQAGFTPLPEVSRRER
jgi:molybdate transport system substrate-binding protein